MSSSELQIRPMSVADLDRVMEIAESLGDAPHWSRSTYRDALEPAAGSSRIALVVVNPETAAVAGFAVAGLIPPQAELEAVVVAADRQRRGLGKGLMRALAVELRVAEIAEILLEVRASNLPALAFYRKLGFRQTGHRPLYYADPEEDAVLMNMRLSAGDL